MTCSTSRRFEQAKRTGRVLILVLVVSSLFFSPRTSAAQTQSTGISDPLGHFEGVGVPGSLSWTGDGQRLTNPSFETGSFAPWLQSRSNTANGSAITLTSPGYQGSQSAELSVYSGNSSALSLASDSTASLSQALSQSKLAVNSATRFRIAVMVQALTGSTVGDRVEASLTFTTSTGNTRTIHYIVGGTASIPGNTATDGYMRVPGFGTTSQWISVDRNLLTDAATFFLDAASINSVQSITFSAHAQSLPGTQFIDPHILFWKASAISNLWQFGEPVVYDANGNGSYDTGETVIGCGYPNSCSAPPGGTVLSTDSRIKWVDSNHDGVWNCFTIASSICTAGEPVVLDNGPPLTSIDGVYDYGEPTINGPPGTPIPIPGTLLEHVIQAHTQALFDQVELYSATGGYDWVLNGGFEGGMTGWSSNTTNNVASSPVHSGQSSAGSSVTGAASETAQSMDARPRVNATMTFQASVDTTLMTGTSSSDYVDLWLGLDDSQGNSLSLYYYFNTGTGNVPTNRTDAVYLKANGFGTMSRWLNVSQSLLQTVQSVVSTNGLAYTAPYTVELVVLEASASTSKTTTVFFDDISLGTQARTTTAPAYFYAQDGLNTTYVYTAASIPQGSFYLDLPLGRSVVNVTTPEGTTLKLSEYTSTASSGSRRVTIPDTSTSKHSPLGDWKIYTSSTNTVSTVYAENPSSHAQAPAINVGTTVNFVSQSKDPLNQPLQNKPVNLTLWNSITGIEVGSPWPGTTSSQGWWNVTGVTLPLSGTQPGVYKLQVVNPDILYPGIRTFQIQVQYTVTIDMSLSASQVQTGETVTISGTVSRTDISGPAQNINVTLYYRLAGNSQWSVLTIVKTDSSGKYSYTWTPPEGEYQVQAKTGDATTAPAETSLAHLIVGSAGLSGLLIALIAAAVVAAAAIFLAFMMLRRKKTVTGTGPAKP